MVLSFIQQAQNICQKPAVEKKKVSKKPVEMFEEEIILKLLHQTDCVLQLTVKCFHISGLCVIFS